MACAGTALSADESVSLTELAQLIEAERPDIVCTQHELVDQYEVRDSRAFVLKSRCDYRPGAEPYVATNHFLIVIREPRHGRQKVTVELHGKSLPPRVNLESTANSRYPAFSLESKGWGMVIAFFIIPIGSACVIFVVALLVLRIRRSHQLRKIVPRRFVLKWQKPRPAQRRSHWTVKEDNESEGPG